MQPSIDAGAGVCWRCRRPIAPGTPWDVGHVEDANGRFVGRYAPEHRGCNRSSGGRKGAELTNRTRAPRASQKRLPNW